MGDKTKSKKICIGVMAAGAILGASCIAVACTTAFSVAFGIAAFLSLGASIIAKRCHSAIVEQENNEKHIQTVCEKIEVKTEGKSLSVSLENMYEAKIDPIIVREPNKLQSNENLDRGQE